MKASDLLPCIRQGDIEPLRVHLHVLRAEIKAHKLAGEVFAGGADSYKYFVLSRQIDLLEEQIKRSL